MGARKVKDAKDLGTGELIYFKGHAKATYMSDGTTVEDAFNNLETVGVVVDSSMSATSINPVQNKVVKSYIDNNCNIPVSIPSTNSVLLRPNIYYKWTGTPTSITITLGTPSDSTILNNYMFEFTSSSSGTTLTMPSSIRWMNGNTPTIESGKTYQVSIINNLATFSKYE